MGVNLKKNSTSFQSTLQRRVRKAFREGMAWAYATPNSSIHQAALRSLSRMNQGFIGSARAAAGQIHIVRGIAVQNGQPLRVAFLGDWAEEPGSALYDYQQRIFRQDTIEIEKQEPIARNKIREEADRLASQVDLVAVREDQSRLWAPNTGDWVSGPSSVRLVFDFQPRDTPQAIAERLGQSSAPGRFRDFLSHREEDFRSFYHQIYLPTVLQFHGMGTSILSETEAFEVFSNRGAVRMMEDTHGQVLGGGLEYTHQGVYYASIRGVLGGSQEFFLTSWGIG